MFEIWKIKKLMDLINLKIRNWFYGIELYARIAKLNGRDPSGE